MFDTTHRGEIENDCGETFLQYEAKISFDSDEPCITITECQLWDPANVCWIATDDWEIFYRAGQHCERELDADPDLLSMLREEALCAEADEMADNARRSAREDGL